MAARKNIKYKDDTSYTTSSKRKTRKVTRRTRKYLKKGEQNPFLQRVMVGMVEILKPYKK
jgi:hypothetical protein